MLTRPIPKTARVGALGTIFIIIIASILLPMARAQKSKKADTPATKEVITDPNTGLQFAKAVSLLNERGFVASRTCSLAPNGKFLLSWMEVIPLDGGKPFKLVDFPSGPGTWSPDGTKVAFNSEGIWVIPVSPDTARPTGPSKKLIDSDDMSDLPWFVWSPDSQAFAYHSSDWRVWMYRLQDGSKVRITDEPGAVPISWHPDGNWIACLWADRFIWLFPVKGGAPRKVVEFQAVSQIRLSPDGNWFFYQDDQKFHFVRLANASCVDVNLPKEVGDYLSWSADGKKLLFYKPAYDYKHSLKIVPASGGAPLEPLKNLRYLGIDQCWTPDSRFVTTYDPYDPERRWVVPIAGGEPFPLQLDVQVQGKLVQESLSPDGKKLLFSVEKGGKKEYWVVAVSIEKGKITGEGVKILDKTGVDCFEWAPDGAKVAFICDGDIWIASADGRPAVRLAETPDGEVPETFLAWSADGKTLTWVLYSGSTKKSTLYICEIPTGESRKLVEASGQCSWAEHSGDGTWIAFHVLDGKKFVLWLIRATGGEPRKLMEVDREEPIEQLAYAFSPNGRELAAGFRGKVSAFSLPDGKSRVIADVNDPVCARNTMLYWSPDGQTIAVDLSLKTPLGPRDRILTVQAHGGKLTELVADDARYTYNLDWSPDGKWIAYSSDSEVKTRPEGVIWEIEVDSLLKKAAEKTAAAPSPTKD